MSNVYGVAYTGITYAAVHNLYGSLFPVEYLLSNKEMGALYRECIITTDYYALNNNACCANNDAQLSTETLQHSMRPCIKIMELINIYLPTSTAFPVFSYRLRYIVGLGLVEMAVVHHPKPTIYHNLYENTGPVI